MTPYYEHAGIAIYCGDCRDVLPSLEPAGACVTDPPYGLSFMDKAWDHGVPGVEFWEFVRAALLPGGACLAFGGTRTHHRLTCAIEDAGFEIRDCLMWLYGTGFPKSHDVSKAIDKAAGVEIESRGHFRFTPADEWTTPGAFRTNAERANPGTRKAAPATPAAKLWSGYGTALKPAWEPIILARNPLAGTVAKNVLEHGVGGLNIDGCRIGTTAWQHPGASKQGTAALGDYEGGEARSHEGGRWPANVALDEEAAAMLDEQSGDVGGGALAQRPPKKRRDRERWRFASGSGHDDQGGASRFFYTSKASNTDRTPDNDHPTVKPTDLMKWLVTLVVPASAAVLDPFMGSGPTLFAAKELGRQAIGIETEERYCEIAAKRLDQEVLAL